METTVKRYESIEKRANNERFKDSRNVEMLCSIAFGVISELQLRLINDIYRIIMIMQL
ncbi:hypothetical protein [Chitinophaga sp. CF418]|uniref:hypothetical protein n=1 Tax=Chitinophaga sp. CF418 TaxID=1855287 RepID=UPI00091BF4A3|nr:hypothetical protein [Chitinophaga sp. CF418]SHN02592.1 hypothetical protein SAMN05216311_104385 [Chitinophaga sp. CF418]